MRTSKFFDLRPLLRQKPDAEASIFGSEDYAQIKGFVRFYQTDLGCVVATEIDGLPYSAESCASPIFGFHIHSGGSCSGNAQDPFADAGTHYNPSNCPHPYHAGDLPPLFGCGGYALALFLTDRFNSSEIIGKTIVIHSMPDDFTSQPSGNSGTKIACGKIV